MKQKGDQEMENRRIVKYDNQLNNLSFRGTGITDNLLKLFFTLVSKVRDQGSSQVEITFEEMRKLTGEKRHFSDSEYKAVVADLYHVLLDLKLSYDSGPFFGEFNIFTGYEGRLDEGKIVVQATAPAQHLFNGLEANFTRFELEEFISLPGIYPKNLYRLLKGFRHMGHYSVLLKDFRNFLDIPDSYKTKEITRRIIDPSVDVLKKNVPEFSDLKYEYSFSGRKAVRVMFTWTPETRYKDVKQAVIEMKRAAREAKNLKENDNYLDETDETVAMNLPF